MARWAAIALAVAAAFAAGWLLGGSGSDGGEELRPGEPAPIPARFGRPRDPTERARSVSYVLIDSDPAAGSLSGHCNFQGIAGGRTDVYLCLIRYNGAPITLRIRHERGTLTYHWAFVADPEPNDFGPEVQGRSGTCEYGTVPCPQG